MASSFARWFEQQTRPLLRLAETWTHSAKQDAPEQLQQASAAPRSPETSPPQQPPPELRPVTPEEQQTFAANFAALIDRVKNVKLADSLHGTFEKVNFQIEKTNANNLEQVIIGYNVAFAARNNRHPDQKIEGLPGSWLMMDFFVKKALGQRVNAKTLQQTLADHGVERELETCENANKLAKGYIRECLEIAPTSLPSPTVSLSDTEISEYHVH